MRSTESKSVVIPDFRLPASTGQTLSLDSYRGKVPLVLVFLPAPDTDPDRSLIEEMNARLLDFGNERSQILGVVKATARTLREMSDEREINLPLLADASGTMARDFDATDDEGIRRVAIVADKEGRLIKRFDPLLTDGGVADAVESLRSTVRDIGAATSGDGTG